MAGAKVNLSLRGINAALSQPGVKRELKRVSEQVADAARASAPVDSGEYVEGIHAEVDDNWVRPRGRVYADAPHSLAVEARTGNLSRALGSESS